MVTRPTGRPRGRPKGKKNASTIQREKRLAKATEKMKLTIPDAFEGNAHEFLSLIYKNPGMPIQTRLDAAKTAVKYETPALASVAHTGKDGEAIEVTLSDMSDLELARRLAFLLAKGAAQAKGD